jgi:hypothetical protein
MTPIGLLPRPPQEVGKISIAVVGGADTLPGVIFTGIAMGNTAESSSEDDAIEIPLFGREVKITETGGGLRLVRAPFFDGIDHSVVMKYLCDYAGIPFKDNTELDYRLPTGNIAISSAVDFKTGTPVYEAMSQVQKMASTVGYFDRYGVYQYYKAAQKTGKNWVYSLQNMKSFSDSTDITVIKNNIFVVGLVEDARQPGEMNKKPVNPIVDDWNTASGAMISVRPVTYPEFKWDKMAFHVLPIKVTEGELKMEAVRVAKAVSSPRGTGSITIPGNAQIELLDSVNEKLAVVGISHNIDLENKVWTTSLELEFMVDLGSDKPVEGEPPQDGNPDGDIPPPENPEDFNLDNKNFDLSQLEFPSGT